MKTDKFRYTKGWKNYLLRRFAKGMSDKQIVTEYMKDRLLVTSSEDSTKAGNAFRLAQVRRSLTVSVRGYRMRYIHAPALMEPMYEGNDLPQEYITRLANHFSKLTFLKCGYDSPLPTNFNAAKKTLGRLVHWARRTNSELSQAYLTDAPLNPDFKTLKQQVVSSQGIAESQIQDIAMLRRFPLDRGLFIFRIV
jgi:hypothetical protein